VITENNVKSGFSIDVLNEIATRRCWTITYGPDGPVSEILKNVAEGRADAALGAIEITAERAKALDFSQPLYDGGLQILVPTGTTSRSLPGLAEFLQVLFSQTMLVWLAAALAIALIPGHITWLLERRHGDSMVSRAYFPGIVQAIGWSLGMLATQPDNFRKHWASRTLGPRAGVRQHHFRLALHRDSDRQPDGVQDQFTDLLGSLRQVRLHPGR